MFEEYRNLPEGIRQAMEAFGTPDDIRRHAKESASATDRLLAMSAELVKQYPDQWAALSGDKLVIAEALPELIRKCDEGGVERRTMATQFLNTKKHIVVL